jgi:hypothetical protein
MIATECLPHQVEGRLEAILTRRREAAEEEEEAAWKRPADHDEVMVVDWRGWPLIAYPHQAAEDEETLIAT